MALKFDDLKTIPGMPKLTDEEYKENLASWGIVASDNGDLLQFDYKELQFFTLCGMGDCKKRMTTRKTN